MESNRRLNQATVIKLAKYLNEFVANDYDKFKNSEEAKEYFASKLGIKSKDLALSSVKSIAKDCGISWRDLVSMRQTSPISLLWETVKILDKRVSTLEELLK